ncbi:MAG: hypothetical protein C4555_04475 [Dehalococcoidia bacterium]|nr:MAG: hypothetical protein C4555_04475 [Dehalococcoidia bacterium]
MPKYPPITYALLSSKKVCSTQLARFRVYFGDGPAPLDDGSARKYADDFNFCGAAEHLLDHADSVKFREAENCAHRLWKEKYRSACLAKGRILKLARGKYNSAVVRAWQRCDAAIGMGPVDRSREYDASVVKAWDDLEAVCIPEWRLWDKKMTGAQSAYSEAVAIAFVRLYRGES